MDDSASLPINSATEYNALQIGDTVIVALPSKPETSGAIISKAFIPEHNGAYLYHYSYQLNNGELRYIAPIHAIKGRVSKR
jgi:hypothetical protein